MKDESIVQHNPKETEKEKYTGFSATSMFSRDPAP